ncbi:ABC-type transport system, involved in lipoprotein release, permease component [Burkholderiales bacterium JOSHI_001]|nr:ABC-type transport system, involved in lipoprotein release, permease component [Burkholderiales bacterium JOSHI_001]
MKSLALAWRNLLRNRRRSLMTLTAMALGLMSVLLFGGYIKDITYAMQTDFVRRSGHLQIQHKDYFRFGSGNPTAYGITHPEKVIEAIRRDPILAPMLLVATPTLNFGAIAGNFAAGASRTVYVQGVVVDEQNRLREWNDYQHRILMKGLALTGTNPDSVVVGTGVARVLHLCAALNVQDCMAEPDAKPASAAPAGVDLPSDIAALASSNARASATGSPRHGSRLELLATSARGAPNVAAVNVVSAEYQGIKELDDVHVGMHLAQAQRLVFGSAPPQVTAIALQLQHTSQMPKARARLLEVLATQFPDSPLGVVDFETLNPFYGQTLGMFAVIFGFISVLIDAIVLFTVTNTMTMVVVERTAEIGTLRAIGLRRKGIQTLFVTEGLLLGCFAAALGTAGSFVLAWMVNHMGMTWVPPGRVDLVPLSVRLDGEHAMLFGSAAALVVVAGLSALIPAFRASRMNIVDALRHV